MPTNTDEYRTLTPEQRFGRQLREWRTSVGESQEEIAHALRLNGLPLSQAQVSRIEKGERPVRLDEVMAICRALELDPMDVLGDAARAVSGPVSLAERTAWLGVVQTQRAVTDQIERLTQGQVELRQRVDALVDAVNYWSAVREPMDRPPARNYAPVYLALSHAGETLGEQLPEPLPIDDAHALEIPAVRSLGTGDHR